MNVKLTGFSLTLGVAVGLVAATVAFAGDQVVEGSAAPASAGSFDAPPTVEGGHGTGSFGFGNYSRVQDRSDDGIGIEAEAGAGANSSIFAATPIQGAISVDSAAVVEGALSAGQIATTVPAQVLALKPVSIQLSDRSVKVIPGVNETTVAVTEQANTTVQQFAGAPSQVSQQVGTVTALIAADAKPEATEAGVSIAAVGTSAPGVVNLILGFQQIGGDFVTAAASSAPLAQQTQMPVLIASAELPPGLLPSQAPVTRQVVAQGLDQRVNPWELNAVIAAYNQVIADCPPEALSQLASNPDFQAIGNQLRQLKAAL